MKYVVWYNHYNILDCFSFVSDLVLANYFYVFVLLNTDANAERHSVFSHKHLLFSTESVQLLEIVLEDFDGKQVNKC